LAGCVVALLLQTAVIIFACALSGSFGIACAIDCAWLKIRFIELIPNIISMHALPDLGQNGNELYIMLGGIGALTLLGCIVQGILWSRKKKRRDIDDSDL
jgi:hypothetical protein